MLDVRRCVYRQTGRLRLIVRNCSGTYGSEVAPRPARCSAVWSPLGEPMTWFQPKSKGLRSRGADGVVSV